MTSFRQIQATAIMRLRARARTPKTENSGHGGMPSRIPAWKNSAERKTFARPGADMGTRLSILE
jgi:hypothetical protein